MSPLRKYGISSISIRASTVSFLLPKYSLNWGGPLNTISPILPGSRAFPVSGSNIFASTPNCGIPMLPGFLFLVGFTCVWPLEVENVLYGIPGIKECCVISTRDNRVGEEVKALIVPKPGFEGKIHEDDIIRHCREHLADYKYPRVIEFVNEIPKTGSGKIDWRLLQERENSKIKT